MTGSSQLSTLYIEEAFELRSGLVQLFKRRSERRAEQLEKGRDDKVLEDPGDVPASQSADGAGGEYPEDRTHESAGPNVTIDLSEPDPEGVDEGAPNGNLIVALPAPPNGSGWVSLLSLTDESESRPAPNGGGWISPGTDDTVSEDPGDVPASQSADGAGGEYSEDRTHYSAGSNGTIDLSELDPEVMDKGASNGDLIVPLISPGTDDSGIQPDESILTTEDGPTFTIAGNERVARPNDTGLWSEVAANRPADVDMEEVKLAVRSLAGCAFERYLQEEDSFPSQGWIWTNRATDGDPWSNDDEYQEMLKMVSTCRDGRSCEAISTLIIHQVVDFEQTDSFSASNARALHRSLTALLRAVMYGTAQSFIKHTRLDEGDADDVDGIRRLFGWTRSVLRHEHQERLLVLDSEGSGLKPSEAVMHMIEVIEGLEVAPGRAERYQPTHRHP